VMSDPVGAGHLRGPHNCGYCDTAVKEAIKEFNLTQLEYPRRLELRLQR